MASKTRTNLGRSSYPSSTATSAYNIPWERQINDSHCSTIITFIGSHNVPERIRKKRWYEFWQWPWTQSWKCTRNFTPLEDFLQRWVANDEVIRIVERENGYNDEDPGMQIVAPLINDALSGE